MAITFLLFGEVGFFDEASDEAEYVDVTESCRPVGAYVPGSVLASWGIAEAETASASASAVKRNTNILERGEQLPKPRQQTNMGNEVAWKYLREALSSISVIKMNWPC